MGMSTRRGNGDILSHVARVRVSVHVSMCAGVYAMLCHALLAAHTARDRPALQLCKTSNDPSMASHLLSSPSLLLLLLLPNGNPSDRCQQPLWPAPAHHGSDAPIRTIYMRSLKHRPFSSLHKLTVFYLFLLFSVIMILMAIARLCEFNVDRAVSLHCFLFLLLPHRLLLSFWASVGACTYCIGHLADDRSRAVCTMNVRKLTVA